MKRIEEVTLLIDDKEKEFEIYVGAYEFIHFECIADICYLNDLQITF